VAAVLGILAGVANGQTTFTYQGQLKDADGPMDDSADFEFRLWDAAAGGSQIGDVEAATLYAGDFDHGLFSVSLDFGAAAFTGEARWLEIAVRSPSGAGDFTTLTPRQEVTPAPYALFAMNSAGGVSLWQEVGTDIFYNAGNVGIGTPTPAVPLDVAGSANITGDLNVDGNITGSVHVSQITGLLGDGHTQQFPDIIDNLATLEMQGIPPGDDVVVLTGPGVDIERVPGFWDDGKHRDHPGFEAEHPFIFEASGALADDMQVYFDTYFADPDTTPWHDFSLIIDQYDGTEAFRWNFFEFVPDSYEPGVDGRTRFTLVNRNLPNQNLEFDFGGVGGEDPFGSELSYNPETDTRVEIEGVSVLYAAVEDDEVNRTLTLTYDYVEGHGIFDWVEFTAEGLLDLKSISWIQDEGPPEVRRNYFSCFPIKYEQFWGYGLDLKIKARVVISYDWAEDA
jgi:hypothetical protein